MSGSQVDKLSDTIRKLVFNTVIQAWLPAVYAALPFLAWPVINQIFLFVLNKVMDPLFDELARFGVFTSIDFKTDAQLRAYTEEAKKLMAAQVGDTWDEEDREKFRAAARNLIRFHGAA